MSALQIQTIQMSKLPRTARKINHVTYYDEATRSVFIDTTTRANHPEFMPGWDIVMGHKSWIKAGRPSIEPPTPEYVKWLANWPLPQNTLVDDDFYRAVYLERMRKSFHKNKEYWHDLIVNNRMEQKKVVLICFCAEGEFCHRYQLADMLIKVAAHFNTPAEYAGEWRA